MSETLQKSRLLILQSSWRIEDVICDCSDYESCARKRQLLSSSCSIQFSDKKRNTTARRVGPDGQEAFPSLLPHPSPGLVLISQGEAEGTFFRQPAGDVLLCFNITQSDPLQLLKTAQTGGKRAQEAGFGVNSPLQDDRARPDGDPSSPGVDRGPAAPSGGRRGTAPISAPGCLQTRRATGKHSLEALLPAGSMAQSLREVLATPIITMGGRRVACRSLSSASV
ncbi:uncharacterized protein LOC126913643 [Cygnus atratus]|uniref:uncharacterized protein LOC126913643 n=1 Tax=Cygnus atratus TaxID=8868 RepID=UPI0021B78EA9|nr:uncharacterized protein LOC126913643 [Cygnus atratus]